ncbi:1-deoxy-D-xylulose 5-phosphate reductoisomerase [Seinonella peptonophila]|uniref:1-deoxy-D-xylulose 5-phosphate reductoisomerase n=1 Tax=Seinonella peptonophila TaxID=112248 RepID=A0A1M5AP15_9BACL|nr:1-deoxy-D-xylulose-5-phosphate reductoisomerase [Seinonella peptonophila]SHF32008.1 1-deoxy-D-xylulose 5-phosphate reductoisomerase [Seinonella peptonophila]
MPERISILGSTGSIGCNTLEVIRQHPEEFEVVALAAGTNADEMVQQVSDFSPKMVVMATKEAAEKVKSEIDQNVPVFYGTDALIEVATHPDATYVVSSIVGSIGLPPTLAAIEAGKKIGLANKETLVTAGHIVVDLARKKEVSLVPIDSEHSAIYQCLNGEQKSEVKRLILTASGGSFRGLSRDQLTNVTPKDALNHPNWSMGSKITIDSATMMNKGLEVIEAHWLFGFPYHQIEVVLHPQSIVHSMVEFVDGAIMAQLGTPDMCVPILYALTSPHRKSLTNERLDFTQATQLDFRPLDFERYPCVRMAYEVGKVGGTLPAVLNAANEVAVDRFLTGQLSFLGIEEVVQQAIEAHNVIKDPSLEEIMDADQWARQLVGQLKK